MNPATGAVLAEVARGDAADVDRAVRAARAAFEDGRWSRKAPAERKEVLDDDVDAIRDEIDDVLETNAEDFVRSFIQKGGQ